MNSYGKPSMWAIRHSAFDFFLFLIKINLTKQQIPQRHMNAFVRRHRSTFDLSTVSYD